MEEVDVMKTSNRKLQMSCELSHCFTWSHSNTIKVLLGRSEASINKPMKKFHQTRFLSRVQSIFQKNTQHQNIWTPWGIISKTSLVLFSAKVTIWVIYVWKMWSYSDLVVTLANKLMKDAKQADQLPRNQMRRRNVLFTSGQKFLGSAYRKFHLDPQWRAKCWETDVLSWCQGIQKFLAKHQRLHWSQTFKFDIQTAPRVYF